MIMNFRYLIYKIMRTNKLTRTNSVEFYLKKYLYVLDILKKEIENKLENLHSEHIWTMWLQDEIPEICDVCIKRIKEVYPTANVITERNLNQFLEIPNYIWEKYKNGTMLPCHFSDFVRVCLLDKYGGTWIDATCFLTMKIPKYITRSEFFVLKNQEMNGISNYFLHSTTNNYLIKAIKIFLLEYWKKEETAINYFFFHYFLKLLIKNDKTAREIFDHTPISLNLNTKLMAKVLYKDFDQDIFDWFMQTSYLHKLSYKKNETIIISEKSLYTYIVKNYN